VPAPTGVSGFAAGGGYPRRVSECHPSQIANRKSPIVPPGEKLLAVTHFARCAVVKMNFDAPTVPFSIPWDAYNSQLGGYPSAGGENAHTSPIANRKSPIVPPGEKLLAVGYWLLAVTHFARCAIVKMNFDAPIAPSASLGMFAPLSREANALPSPIANRQSPIGNHCSRDVNFACRRGLIDDFRYPIGEVGWHKLPPATCYFFLSYIRCAIVKIPKGWRCHEF